jgi:hypothetical protein
MILVDTDHATFLESPSSQKVAFRSAKGHAPKSRLSLRERACPKKSPFAPRKGMPQKVAFRSAKGHAFAERKPTQRPRGRRPQRPSKVTFSGTKPKDRCPGLSHVLVRTSPARHKPSARAIDPARLSALPSKLIRPSPSKTTHGVAIGSRCAHLRAKTRAQSKNATGNPMLRELWWHGAPSATTARPRSRAWRQMSAP